MNNRDICILAFKIMGIYLLIQAIVGLPTMLTTALMLMFSHATFGSAAMSVGYLFSGLLTCGLQFLAGASLITKTDVLAGLLFPQRGAEADVHAFSLRDVQTVAFSIVGLVFMVQAIVQLPSFVMDCYVAMAYSKAAAGPNLDSPSHRFFVVLFQMIVKFAAGAWLFWSGRVLADFWHKLRIATGTPTTGEKQ